jgi:DNA-binding NarL/FixJ family response regulator
MEFGAGAVMKEAHVRILAIEHNGILRAGLEALISPEHDLYLATTLPSAEHAISTFAEIRPDLTLIDLDLPNNGALDTIYSIIQENPDAWIIGLVTDDLGSISRQAIVAGAATIVGKHAVGHRLLPLIRSGPARDTSNRWNPLVGEFVHPRLRLLKRGK